MENTFQTLLCSGFSAEGLSQHPRHPGRWWQENTPRPGLERFELELLYLALTFLLLEFLDTCQTSKVSYSQIFLRLVMRYQSLTQKPCPTFLCIMQGQCSMASAELGSGVMVLPASPCSASSSCISWARLGISRHLQVIQTLAVFTAKQAFEHFCHWTRAAQG